MTKDFSSKHFFGSRADRYAEMQVFSEESYYQPIFELANPQGTDKILDLATGTGLLAIILGRKAREVVGCDITKEMLEKAKERLSGYPKDNVRFVEAPADQLPFEPQSFDIVTCRAAFHHFPEPLLALSEISRVLKPGGRLILEDIQGPEEGDARSAREEIEKLFDPSHVWSYSVSEFTDLLAGAGLAIGNTVEKLNTEWPLDELLYLDNVEDPAVIADIRHLLQENINCDLGGFKAIEKQGQIWIQIEGILFSSTKRD